MSSSSSSSSSDYSEKPAKVGGIKRKYDSSGNKSSYSSKSLPYDKKNVSHNSQSQVTKFRKTYKNISPDAQMIVDQIIDPEMQMNVQQIPAYGVASTYTSHNILQCAYDANGVSSVTVYPCLQGAIYATSGDVYTQPLTAFGGADNPYCVQSVSLASSGASADFSQPFYFNSRHVALPKPSVRGGRMIYPIKHTTVATSPLVFRFQLDNLHSATNLQAMLQFFDADEALLLTTSNLFDATGAVSLSAWNNVASLNAVWIALRITTLGQTTPYEGGCLVQITDPTELDPGVQLTNVSQHCISYSLNGYTDITRSGESYFVSAQSCLLTYEGSDLNSGGRLAIARIPQNAVVGQPGGNSGTPQFSTWYDWISSLSRNSYNGRVKSGGYCFYLGQDDRSYFYRPVEEVYPPELPYIAAEWSTELDSPQAVRIMVTTVVQFTTNSNVFNQSPCPYLGEDWCKILHILSCINASYDNPGHRKKLSDALKKVGGKVVGLLKDPTTYITLAKLATALAAV